MSQHMIMRMIFMKTILNPPVEEPRKGCLGFGAECGHESPGLAHSSCVSGNISKEVNIAGLSNASRKKVEV